MNVRIDSALASLLVNAALLVALLLGFGLQAPAYAETPSVTLQIGQQLSRGEAGHATLHARIERAAKRLCRSNATGTRIDRKHAPCVERSIAEAVERVNDPAFTAYHREKAGAAPARIAGSR